MKYQGAFSKSMRFGGKRFLFSPPPPPPFPLAFFFLPLYCSRNNSIGNACYASYKLAENEIFLRHRSDSDWGGFSWSAVWVEWSAIKGMHITWGKPMILGRHLVEPTLLFIHLVHIWFISDSSRFARVLACFRFEYWFRIYRALLEYMLSKCGQRPSSCR